MRRAGMQRKTRRTVQILATILVAFGVLELTAAALLRALRPPRVSSSPAPFVRVPSPLAVGAAALPIELPVKRPLAGFGLFRPAARGSAGTWEARAVVIGKLAIVSLDVLEIPPSLEAVVSRMAGPDLTVWLCATHTHSGPAGYDPARLPQLFGARRFQPGVFNALAEAASASIAAAAWAQRPARIRWASVANPGLQVARSSSSAPDPTLWAIEADGEDGLPIATLVAFGAHPTLVSRKDALASPDWPGATAEALERRGGVGIVVQAIGGDSSAAAEAAGADRRVAFGEKVAKAALDALSGKPELLAPAQELAEDTVNLEWNLDVLLHFPVPGTSEPVATLLRTASIGDLQLVCLPGEVTGSAWREITAFGPPRERLMPITLCGDELSYVESTRLIHEGKGERLVMYPTAAPKLGDSLLRLSDRGSHRVFK